MFREKDLSFSLTDSLTSVASLHDWVYLDGGIETARVGQFRAWQREWIARTDSAIFTEGEILGGDKVASAIEAPRSLVPRRIIASVPGPLDRIIVDIPLAEDEKDKRVSAVTPGCPRCDTGTLSGMFR